MIFIITQPDKPTGRTQVLSPTPVKAWAQKMNIKVLTPTKISEAAEEIINANADLMLVAAYGQIIPKTILDMPKFGSVNIHGSILPKYRGASPVQTAILNGDDTTGITLIKMDEKMDHGPILATARTQIGPSDNFQTVYEKLSKQAADLSFDILPKYISGEIKPVEQDHALATFTTLLTKENGKIDWTKTSREIYNLIRALNPEPGTFTTLGGKTVKILEVKHLNNHMIDIPGKIKKIPGGMEVKTSDSALEIIKIQPEGKKPMSGKDFINGLVQIENKHFV